MALSEPEYARVDYWRAEQKDSKYSKANFVRKLIDAHDQLLHRIESKEAEFKALNPDAGEPNYGLPLVYETDNELNGHIKKSDLNELSISLSDLAKSFELYGGSDDGKKQNKSSIKIDKEEIKLFCHDDFGIEMYQKVKSIFDNDNEAGYVGFKIVTDLAQVAKMFEDQPFKVISYIRSYLSNYLSFNSATSKKLLNVVIQILEKRDENKTSGLKLIIAELRSSDFEYPDDSFQEDVSPLDTGSEMKGRKTEYFGVEYIDVETYVKGYGVAFGLIEPKKEKFKKFIAEYKDELHAYLDLKGKTRYSKSSEIKKERVPIHWLNGEKSLRQFIDSLKSAGLIENRETDEIIKEHFDVDGKKPTNKEPQPIIWLESLSLLAYMIEALDRKYIKPDNIWSDTMPHFLKNGQTPENMRQTANRYKDNKTGKPKGYQIIDDIFGKLTI